MKDTDTLEKLRIQISKLHSSKLEFLEIGEI